MLQKLKDVEFVFVHRAVDIARGARDLRREQQKQENVGDVELPGSPEQPFGGGDKLAATYCRTIDVAGAIAGDEHKEFGGVAETIISDRQPADDVVGDR